MAHAPRVTIQQADFDVAAELRALHAHDHGVGAVTTFVGTVRDRNGPTKVVTAPTP